MYIYGWFVLRCDRKQQNSAKQLKDFHKFFNFYWRISIKKIKRKKESLMEGQKVKGRKGIISSGSHKWQLPPKYQSLLTSQCGGQWRRRLAFGLSDSSSFGWNSTPSVDLSPPIITSPALTTVDFNSADSTTGALAFSHHCESSFLCVCLSRPTLIHSTFLSSFLLSFTSILLQLCTFNAKKE